MIDIQTKVCTKCGENKPFSEYNKHKGGKFGLSGMCKECKKVYRKKWYAENPNYNKEYYNTNREKLLKDTMVYKEKNKNKVDTNNKLYRKNNKDIISDRNRVYKDNNREKVYANCAKRRARKKNACVELTEQELYTIKLYYKLSTSIGKEYHVDHIVPLNKGGLHYPDNLQILHKQDNLSKNDKLAYEYKHPRYVIKDNQLVKII